MKIKYIIMDVDGSLTDGKVYMGNDGELIKAFSIKDGYAINYILKPVKIEPVVITARQSKIVENRCEELGIEKVYQGILDKLTKLKELVGSSFLGECAYFGDDILDLPCMEAIIAAGGIVGCPADAVIEVKSKADYICKNKAGEGAFREFTEWLVSEKSNKDEIKKRIDFALDYLKNLDMRTVKDKVCVNDYFYYFIQEYNTKDMKNSEMESHIKYADVQWIIEGEEEFGIADIQYLNKLKEYSEENDIILWKPNELLTRVVLRADSYIVLLPQNAHMVSGINDGSMVKKIVGKVKLVD